MNNQDSSQLDQYLSDLYLASQDMIEKNINRDLPELNNSHFDEQILASANQVHSKSRPAPVNRTTIYATAASLGTFFIGALYFFPSATTIELKTVERPHLLPLEQPLNSPIQSANKTSPLRPISENTYITALPQAVIKSPPLEKPATEPTQVSHLTPPDLSTPQLFQQAITSSDTHRLTQKEAKQQLNQRFIATHSNHRHDAADFNKGINALAKGNVYHVMGFSAAHYFMNIIERNPQNSLAKSGLAISFQHTYARPHSLDRVKQEIPNQIKQLKVALKNSSDSATKKSLKRMIKHYKKAQSAFRKKWFVLPKNKNAYYHLLTILTLDPSADFAQYAIETLLEEVGKEVDAFALNHSSEEISDKLTELSNGDICPLYLQYLFQRNSMSLKNEI